MTALHVGGEEIEGVLVSAGALESATAEVVAGIAVVVLPPLGEVGGLGVGQPFEQLDVPLVNHPAGEFVYGLLTFVLGFENANTSYNNAFDRETRLTTSPCVPDELTSKTPLVSP